MKGVALRMKKTFSLLLIVALLVGCFAFAGAESLPEKDLIILYTGDVHCAVDKGWGYAGLYAMKEEPLQQTMMCSWSTAATISAGKRPEC